MRTNSLRTISCSSEKSRAAPAAVSRGPEDDRQPQRRGGPVQETLTRAYAGLRRLHARLERPSVAVPHHGEHLRQHLPEATARAGASQPELEVHTQPPRSAQSAARWPTRRPPRTRCSGSSPTRNSGRRSRSCRSASRPPSTWRHRGLLLQRRRGDNRRADRHRDVAAAQGRGPAARAAGRARSRTTPLLNQCRS